MLKEVEYEFNDNTYLIKQLETEKAQEVLVHLLRLVGDVEGISLQSLPSRVSVKDVNFLREALFGEHCLLMNESGNWAPLGRALVNQHFAGRLGAMFHLLGKCLMVNFADFLADLRLDQLVGSEVLSKHQSTLTGLSGE